MKQFSFRSAVCKYAQALVKKGCTLSLAMKQAWQIMKLNLENDKERTDLMTDMRLGMRAIMLYTKKNGETLVYEVLRTQDAIQQAGVPKHYTPDKPNLMKAVKVSHDKASGADIYEWRSFIAEGIVTYGLL